MLPERPLHHLVEPAHDHIVAVKHVNEVPARPCQARVEIAHVADVLRLTEEAYSAGRQLAYDRFGVVLHGVIIDHFDLHRLGSGILLQDTPQGLTKELGAIEGRNHHGPEGPGSILVGHRIH